MFKGALSIHPYTDSQNASLFERNITGVNFQNIGELFI